MSKHRMAMLLLEIFVVSVCASLAQVVPRRVRVSQTVMQGLLLQQVKPDYPPDAEKQRVEGVVLLQVRIDKKGNVDKVDLISGHPLLAPAAIEAVKKWKYKPFLLNGEAVTVETQVKVNFALKGNHPGQRTKP